MMEHIFADENLPPPVANQNNVSAEEVVSQKNYVKILGKRKAVVPNVVLDQVVAEAEVELHKRVKAYQGGVDLAPAWFNNAMANINNRLDHIENRLDQIENRLDRLQNDARIHVANSRRRLNNAVNSSFIRLLCEDVNSNHYGQEPPANLRFPEFRELGYRTLVTADLDALQEFYGFNCTAGNNLAQRVSTFMIYISDKA